MFPARLWILHLSIPALLLGPSVALATDAPCVIDRPDDDGVIIVPIEGHGDDQGKVSDEHGEGPIVLEPRGIADAALNEDRRVDDPEIILKPIKEENPDIGFANSLKHGKTFMFLSRHSGKCLDVAAHGKAPGAALHQWDCHAKGNQKFTAYEVKKGEFLLVGEESKLCLQPRSASTCNGAPVQLSNDCQGSSARLKAKASGPGSFALSFAHSGKCLDVSGPTSKNGALIQQWSCHGRDNQDWFLLQTN